MTFDFDEDSSLMTIGGMITSFEKQLPFISLYKYEGTSPTHLDTQIIECNKTVPIISPFIHTKKGLFILLSHSNMLSVIEVLTSTEKLDYENTVYDSVKSNIWAK